MAEMKKQNFLHGAAILTVSAVIIKILGAIYKIPLYNILGTQGTADFNYTYNIYNVLLMFSTAGLPVAVSRLIAEANTLGKSNQAKRIFNVALTVFVVLGSLGSLAMLIFPTQLAIMVGNVQSAPGILTMAPAVLLVCILSAYRGWEQGHSNMIPTSVTQVIEVAIKVILGLVISWALIRNGAPESHAAAGAMVGVSLGTLVACVYIFIVKRRNMKNLAGAGDDVPDSVGRVLKSLFRIGVPIALGAAAMSIIQLIDSKIISYVMQNILQYSYDDTMEHFGSYSMLLPFHNLPWFFVTPFTVSLVPAIASNMVQKNYSQARYVTEVSIRGATVISLPMGIGMAALSYPIANAFYYGKVTADAPFQLALLGIASYLMCMALMTTSILQAMGRERLSVISLVTGGAVKIATNFLLISNPAININGTAISSVICYLVMAAMNYVFIQNNMPQKISLAGAVMRPIMSAVPMGVVAWAVYAPLAGLLSGGGEPTRLSMLLAMGIAVVLAVIIYLVMVIATRAITLDDLKLIPKGERLAKLLRIKK